MQTLSSFIIVSNLESRNSIKAFRVEDVWITSPVEIRKVVVEFFLPIMLMLMFGIDRGWMRFSLISFMTRRMRF